MIQFRQIRQLTPAAEQFARTASIEKIYATIQQTVAIRDMYDRRIAWLESLRDSRERDVWRQGPSE